jgi:CRISPR-associated exonuclease Cas4
VVSDRPLPLSALEHHEYCPRQCALVHADGVWHDNAHTVRGGFGHRRADSGASRMERGASVLRAVPLWSEHHDLIGRADVVEVYADGSVAPVEYKIGTRHGLAADVQLCAQALCLEEMTGHPVEDGWVWYSAPRRRERVVFDAVLRRRTLDAIATVRATISRGVLPVAVDDARCEQCQLIDHCLPSLTSARGPRAVSAYLAREVWRCGS